MSASEIVVEKVKNLSEIEAEAVLEFISALSQHPAGRDAERELEAACVAANKDAPLNREISEWQGFDDTIAD